MRKIISLICFLLPALACADQLQMRPDARPDIRQDAPDRHIVVKGDTLWDISGKFFKDPWKWPHIWGLNKDTIKDPHWIYPGDVINLDRASGTLRIGEAAEVKPAESAAETKPDVVKTTDDVVAPAVKEPVETKQVVVEPVDTGNTIRLSPKVRERTSGRDAIPSIPANILGPFLVQPLVIEEDELKDAPVMLGARESRVLLGKNDVGFARGLTADKGDKWQVYRPGKKFVDPKTEEVLGIEAFYLGSAEVTAFADVSTVAITQSVQEINQGDLLTTVSNDSAGPYLPRSPEFTIDASVISIYGGVSQAGQYSAIVLNKGARDGLEVGHVLALYRKGENVKEKSKSFWSWDKTYTLPDERYGLIFVFRVFNKVSYALVMETKLPVQLLDRALTP